MDALDSAARRSLRSSAAGRGSFLRLCGVSVVLWTLFEALNLRLGNWYYVMDHPSRAARWLGGVVAFATVLPAILGTESVLLEGRTGSATCRCRRSGGAGAATWPASPSGSRVSCSLSRGRTSSFPWRGEAWSSFSNRGIAGTRAGACCGTWRRERPVLCCGPCSRASCAGFLWELWNFWARTKWVYTVPGVEALKVFEMPLLGFLGFPPFAVECQSAVRFLEAWRERTESASAARGVGILRGGTIAVSRSRSRSWCSPPPIPGPSTRSMRRVERLEVLSARDRARLVASGLESPEALLRALSSEVDRREWSAPHRHPSRRAAGHSRSASRS